MCALAHSLFPENIYLFPFPSLAFPASLSLSFFPPSHLNKGKRRKTSFIALLRMPMTINDVLFHEDL